MSQCCSGEPDSVATHRSAALWAADALSLAASPTFAIMALVSAVTGGGSTEMLGIGAHASQMSGMVTMYLLMSAFHATAWIKLIRLGGRDGPWMNQGTTTMPIAVDGIGRCSVVRGSAST